jgi:hypothetical protein
MTQRHSSRSLSLLVLAAVLGFALVGLSQCRSISDNVSGVQLRTAGSLSGKSDCVRRCNDQYKADQRSEEARHKAALKSCGRDNVCKQEENNVHKKLLAGIVAHKNACKRSCYNEGAGSGI